MVRSGSVYHYWWKWGVLLHICAVLHMRVLRRWLAPHTQSVTCLLPRACAGSGKPFYSAMDGTESYTELLATVGVPGFARLVPKNIKPL